MPCGDNYWQEEVYLIFMTSRLVVCFGVEAELRTTKRAAVLHIKPCPETPATMLRQAALALVATHAAALDNVRHRSATR